MKVLSWFFVLCLLAWLAIRPAEAKPVLKGFDLDVSCLALNVYHESAHESVQSRQAVALVTVNRMYNRKLDVCDTVFQPKQFSWTIGSLDGNRLKPAYLPRGKKWQEARKIAHSVLTGQVKDFTKGATHYHAYYVHPYWASKMRKVGKWGSHYFYVKA